MVDITIAQRANQNRISNNKLLNNVMLLILYTNDAKIIEE